jgi:NADH dehydrogenase
MEIMLETIERRRLLMSLPFSLARGLALFCEVLPSPPLTRDQVELMRADNIVTGDNGLDVFGIRPQSLEVILPTYLDRYRPGGRFTGRSPLVSA